MPNDIEKKSILIIDDSNVFRKAVTIHLMKENFVVDGADSGKSGMIKLHGEKDYDLILLDYEMGDMTGLEFIKTFKLLKEYLDTPIIVLTGHSEAKIVKEMIKNGASGYFIKSGEFDPLIQKIKDLL